MRETENGKFIGNECLGDNARHGEFCVNDIHLRGWAVHCECECHHQQAQDAKQVRSGEKVVETDGAFTRVFEIQPDGSRRKVCERVAGVVIFQEPTTRIGNPNLSTTTTN